MYEVSIKTITTMQAATIAHVVMQKGKRFSVENYQQ